MAPSNQERSKSLRQELMVDPAPPFNHRAMPTRSPNAVRLNQRKIEQILHENKKRSLVQTNEEAIAAAKSKYVSKQIAFIKERVGGIQQHIRIT
jgi:hypothetical protein